MASRQKGRTAHVGDWIEARGIHGQPARRGRIIELIGRDGRDRYNTSWEEQQESILYPADGVVILPTSRRRGSSRALDAGFRRLRGEGAE